MTEWIGEPTAATPLFVSTWTSWIPCASSAVTAPRAVAPNLITTAVSRRPWSPVEPVSASASSTEQ